MTTNKLILLFSLSLFLLFAGCQTAVQKNKLTTEKQAELILKGKTIARKSFQALSGELLKALQEGGVQHAVGYCHLQASPVIDSLSKTYSVQISRISDKYRNPGNKPGKPDMTVIDGYRQQMEEGQELQPHLEMTEDEIVFYSPILILNPACLQCHGEPGSTMEQVNYDFIKSKYPGDLAVGYKLGDLRGVWKIILGSEF
jgi:hypothetical protein